MGRKTYESLGKPLKGRTNIIVSRSDATTTISKTGLSSEINICQSIDEAIIVAEQTDAKQCSIIGGGEIYKQSMNIASRIYMTRVQAVLEGDTYFPMIDENEWKLTSSMSFEKDEKHMYSYRFETWERK